MRNSLYQYQRVHADILLSRLTEHKVTIDASVTGAGKTIVAVYILYKLAVLDKLVDRVIIVAPPTLLPQWKKAVDGVKNKDGERPWIQVQSAYSMQKIGGKRGGALLIADEFHIFKNVNKLSAQFSTLVSGVKYALLLSATPFDDDRQIEGGLKQFVPQELLNTRAELMNQMQFRYSHPVLYRYCLVDQTEEEQKLYKYGYRLIVCSSRVQDDTGATRFSPQMYGKGYRMIHDSLIAGCVRYIVHKAGFGGVLKIVVVLYFQDHFDLLEEELRLGSLGIVNGKTSQKDRVSLVAEFNDPKSSMNVLAISSDVGGVGIELDDQVGGMPREMVMLPVANGVSFFQSTGRIQRSKTRSACKVTMIQPRRKHTFFRRFIGKKFETMASFCERPKFGVMVETHKCNLAWLQLKWLGLPDYPTQNIQGYLCSCADWSLL